MHEHAEVMAELLNERRMMRRVMEKVPAATIGTIGDGLLAKLDREIAALEDVVAVLSEDTEAAHG